MLLFGHFDSAKAFLVHFLVSFAEFMVHHKFVLKESLFYSSVFGSPLLSLFFSVSRDWKQSLSLFFIASNAVICWILVVSYVCLIYCVAYEILYSSGGLCGFFCFCFVWHNSWRVFRCWLQFGQERSSYVSIKGLIRHRDHDMKKMQVLERENKWAAGEAQSWRRYRTDATFGQKNKKGGIQVTVHRSYVQRPERSCWGVLILFCWFHVQS